MENCQKGAGNWDGNQVELIGKYDEIGLSLGGEETQQTIHAFVQFPTAQ
jgi:hypothetical protein